jgi:hypothetical protein
MFGRKLRTGAVPKGGVVAVVMLVSGAVATSIAAPAPSEHPEGSAGPSGHASRVGTGTMPSGDRYEVWAYDGPGERCFEVRSSEPRTGACWSTASDRGGMGVMRASAAGGEVVVALPASAADRVEVRRTDGATAVGKVQTLDDGGTLAHVALPAANTSRAAAPAQRAPVEVESVSADGRVVESALAAR